MTWLYWIFTNDELKVDIHMRAVDRGAAKTCMKLLLRNYNPKEWRISEVTVV